MTNYEKKLKEMTPDYLAFLLFNNGNCQNCPIYTKCEGFTCGYDCRRNILRWLKSEVEK